MKNIIKIWKSEFLTIAKDPGTVLVMIIAAFMYSLFYSIPFTTQILRDVPIGVVDLDNSSFSRELTRDLDSSELLHVATRPLDAQEAKEQFNENKIRAYVVIPKDFEKELFRGQKSSIGLFEDSSYLIVYKQVATGVMTTAGSLGAKIEVGKFMKKGLSKQQAIRMKLPFSFVEIPLFNPAGDYENYIYPLVLVLILQQTMLVGVGLLGGTLREQMRGRKKWLGGLVVEVKRDSLCDFTNNPASIVFGKSLAYVSLYLIHSSFYFLVYPALFGYKMTYNLLPLALILIPFLFAVAFLAQALIYFYKDRETSMLMLVVTSVPMVFLPGFVWPKEAIPFWVNSVANFIPSTSAIGALTRINQMGASFYQVSDCFWTLVALCALYFVLACVSTKKICK